MLESDEMTCTECELKFDNCSICTDNVCSTCDTNYVLDTDN